MNSRREVRNWDAKTWKRKREKIKSLSELQWPGRGGVGEFCWKIFKKKTGCRCQSCQGFGKSNSNVKNLAATEQRGQLMTDWWDVVTWPGRGEMSYSVCSWNAAALKFKKHILPAFQITITITTSASCGVSNATTTTCSQYCEPTRSSRHHGNMLSCGPVVSTFWCLLHKITNSGQFS